MVHRPIKGAEDFSSLPELSDSHPSLDEHCEAVELVVKEIGNEVDCLATLFSPLAVLGLSTGTIGEPLISFMKEKPNDAHMALEHISQTLTDHAKRLIEIGASGLFYAPLQWTSFDLCPAEIYEEFGRPYDLELLKAVSNAPFNMLHVCVDNIGIDRFYDYPVQVLNWDNFGKGNPFLEDVAKASDKIVAGGIPHKKLHKLSIDDLTTVAKESLSMLKGNLMLAGGYGIGATVSDEARTNAVTCACNIEMT